MPVVKSKRLLKAPEAADYLGISRTMLYERTDIPSIYIGTSQRSMKSPCVVRFWQTIGIATGVVVVQDWAEQPRPRLSAHWRRFGLTPSTANMTFNIK